MNILNEVILQNTDKSKHNILLMGDAIITATMAADTHKVYWKTVDGHPQYLVSTEGDVYSIRRRKNLKPGISGSGYYMVYMDYEALYIHRLVAHAFVLGEDKWLVVDHIDHNRKNNRFDNLRWVTQSENQMNRKPIAYKGQAVKLTYHAPCNDVHLWCKNIVTAANQLMFKPSRLYEVLYDDRPSYKGWTVEIVSYEDYKLLFDEETRLSTRDVYDDSSYDGVWRKRNIPVLWVEEDVAFSSLEEAEHRLGTDIERTFIEISTDAYLTHGLHWAEYVMLYGEGSE